MFLLGVSLAALFFPLGIAVGTNLIKNEELKKFNQSKGHILRRIIE